MINENIYYRLKSLQLEILKNTHESLIHTGRNMGQTGKKNRIWRA